MAHKASLSQSNPVQNESNNNVLEGLPRRMKFKCTFSATISDTFKKRGWIDADDYKEDWDIYFCDMNQMRDLFTSSSRALEEHQRIGHFRNNFEISRKNFMVRNLKRLKARIERAFGKDEGKKCMFFPQTFVLPTEERWFLTEFRYKPGAFWIIKPAAGAQGRGIFIFGNIKEYYNWRIKLEGNSQTQVQNLSPQQQQSYQQYVLERLKISPNDLKKEEGIGIEPKSSSDIVELDPEIHDVHDPLFTPSMDDLLLTHDYDPSKTESSKNNNIYVIQQYIANPYLIGGRKFDIRFFVLVTSFTPLKAWMYREGFARFSAGQYSLESLQDVYIHLTNVAIQRTAEDYNPEKGSKWSLRNLRQYLTARHGHLIVQNLMNNIDNIIIRTLQSVHQLVIQDRHCFEVYGFDVLIDDCVKPWLLEVNCSPSFSPSNEEDYKLKCSIIDDTVNVLDVEGRLTGFEKRVGGYDMIWNDGPIYAVPGDCGHVEGCDDGEKLNSFLGCMNDRIEQLRNIHTNSYFLRQVMKENSGPNYSKDITLVGPSVRGKVFSKSPPRDDRFRLPTSSRETPPIRSRSSAPRFQGQGPFMVLGKAVHMRRNLNTFLQRCSADNNRRFPV